MAQTIPFQVVRTRSGALKAETRMPLDNERRELRITTDKALRGGIESDARVVQVSEDGKSYQHAFSMLGDGSGDWSRTILTDRTKRATLKALETMHAEALAGIDAILEEARAYYAAQASKKAAEVNAFCAEG